MQRKAVLHVLGMLLLSLSAILLVPMLVALIYMGGDGPGQATEWRAFLYASLLAAGTGGGLHFLLRDHGEVVRPAEGFGVVTLGWIFISAFGALPFYFADIDLSYSDAYFETMSGFTTTVLKVCPPA